jgi:hypothetical protein
MSACAVVVILKHVAAYDFDNFKRLIPCDVSV